ncbi:MAG: hypothetical protein HOV81_08750 [Kofleriaceae bacterium]|nr:hypothetical protein [Kofleriaceae bacterium]
MWRQQPTPDAFRTRNAALLELSKEHANHSALIEIVEETSKPPSDETRRVAMEVFKTLGSSLSGIAMTLEGNQVRSALNRAILTSMMFFVKQLQPTKIFKHPADAARWIRPYVQVSESGFENNLVAALEELRSSIKAA